MSRTSIKQNNQAIAEIDLAISKYEDAISKISINNDNERINGIISLINNDILSLKKAKATLEFINSQIELEMRKADELEKKRRRNK